MILGMTIEQFITAATFFGTALLGALTLIGNAWGRRNPPQRSPEVEIAGALVDAGSIKELTEAVKVHTTAIKFEADRSRKVGHEMVESIDSLTREVGELRGELRVMRAR